MSLSSNEQLEFKLLTREKMQEALKIQTETMKQECLAIGFGMFEEAGAVEEMRMLFTEIVKDGSTIMAVDRETDKLAAVAFNKIHARPREGEKDQLEIFIKENLKHRACQELVKFLDRIQMNVDIFKNYNANGAIELFYLGTDPRYQGRGIGSQMVRKCIEFGRGLLNGTMKRSSIDGGVGNEQVLPEFIYGVFASNYSQRIAETMGFEILHEVRYDDYSFAGKKLSEMIGDVHRSARLQGLRL